MTHQLYGARGNVINTFGGYPLYILFCKPYRELRFFKIGISTFVMGRMPQLLCGCPFEFDRVVYTYVGNSKEAHAAEASLHREMAKLSTCREWFCMREGNDDDSKEFNDAIFRTWGQELQEMQESMGTQPDGSGVPTKWNRISEEAIKGYMALQRPSKRRRPKHRRAA